MRPSKKSIDTSESTVAVEVSAFLDRMRGLSSAGIVQALADCGWDSTRFASEIMRMYDGTDESFYKHKLLAMMVDLMKQKEGQRIHVDDDISGATDDELKQMEAKVAGTVATLLNGGESHAVGLIETDPREAGCPSPVRKHASKGKARTRQARLGDPSAIHTNAEAEVVSCKPSRNTHTKRG
jgi:hypothetical protein